MGVAFKDSLVATPVEFADLQNKTVLLDAHNVLYQFLTSIRGRDGALLQDSQGNVTAHLVGLFNRSSTLMQKGIKLAFVFDGKPPELKHKTLQARRAVKEEAAKKFLEAQRRDDAEEMRKFAARTTRLTKEMTAEAQELLTYLGIPVVQAPSEGEAQAAHMVKNGTGFAVGSQDFDSLIHGSPKLLRNLSLAGKRKKTNTLHYEVIKPEIIDLAENLNQLGIDQNQLIALAMLVGTDYNQGGIKGIGPKNALKLVKQFGNDLEALFKHVKWDEHCDEDWNEVYYLIKNIPTTDDYSLQWKNPNREKIIELLVEKHEFSKDRVETTLDKSQKESSKKQQTTLGSF